jgi:hypothetical protein
MFIAEVFESAELLTEESNSYQYRWEFFFDSVLHPDGLILSGIWLTVSIAVTIAEIAWVIGIAIKAGGSIQFNPPRLDVAGVTVTVAVAWVEVKTHCTPRWLHMAKAWRR